MSVELTRRQFNLGLFKSFCAVGVAGGLALPVGLSKPQVEYILVRNSASSYYLDAHRYSILRDTTDAQGTHKVKYVENVDVTCTGQFAKEHPGWEHKQRARLAKKYNIVKYKEYT